MKKKKKLLVTAFEPFGKLKQNPSKQLLQELKKRQVCDTTLLKTTYQDCEAQIVRSIKRKKPDIVIMTGLAAGIPKLHLERFAINFDDSEQPDNKGVIRQDFPIDPQKQLALPSTLPLKQIINDLQKAHIPAGISNSAGTYVCNHLFYFTQDYLAEHHPKILSGFLHLPCSTRQVCEENLNFPSMSLEMMIQAIEIIQNSCEKYFQNSTKLYPPL